VGNVTRRCTAFWKSRGLPTVHNEVHVASEENVKEEDAEEGLK